MLRQRVAWKRWDTSSKSASARGVSRFCLRMLWVCPFKVLSESSYAALVEFSFSRIDVSGNAFLNSTGHYGLVNTDDGWKIQSMFFVNPITVGTD